MNTTDYKEPILHHVAGYLLNTLKSYDYNPANLILLHQTTSDQLQAAIETAISSHSSPKLILLLSTYASVLEEIINNTVVQCEYIHNISETLDILLELFEQEGDGNSITAEDLRSQLEFIHATAHTAHDRVQKVSFKNLEAMQAFKEYQNENMQTAGDPGIKMMFEGIGQVTVLTGLTVAIGPVVGLAAIPLIAARHYQVADRHEEAVKLSSTIHDVQSQLLYGHTGANAVLRNHHHLLLYILSAVGNVLQNIGCEKALNELLAAPGGVTEMQRILAELCKLFHKFYKCMHDYAKHSQANPYLSKKLQDTLCSTKIVRK